MTTNSDGIPGGADKNLIFIDTNVYLDFYRINNEARAEFIDKIGRIKKRVIITMQVFMEFNKNRQVVITNTINSIKMPERITRPGLLSNDESFHLLKEHIENAQNEVKEIKTKMHDLIKNPERNDPVYKLIHDMYQKRDSHVLTDDNEQYQELISLALNKSRLGYPPQKDSYSSAGDALNWEWIVRVAQIEKP